MHRQAPPPEPARDARPGSAIAAEIASLLAPIVKARVQPRKLALGKNEVTPSGRR